MQVVNQSQKNIRWQISQPVGNDVWVKTECVNNIKPSIEKLDGPPHLAAYYCKLNWHYSIVSKEDNNVLFDYEYQEVNRIVSKKGVYEADKIKTMLLFSNIQFVSLFDTRKHRSSLNWVTIPEIAPAELVYIENEIRHMMMQVEGEE